jgi:hypothetical protein
MSLRVSQSQSLRASEQSFVGRPRRLSDSATPRLRPEEVIK